MIEENPTRTFSLNILRTYINREKILKTEEIQAIAKIESSALKGARKYCEENGFIEIMVPHITKATGSCENFLTVFEVDYFGKKMYLTQTGQLYLEVLTPFLKKVWCIIHSFRAEPDVDDRHLTEFPLIELEFEGNFEDLIKHIEGIIYSMVSKVEEERKEELEKFEVDKEYLSIFKPPYKRITYTKAIEILKEIGIDIDWGDDIKSTHEKILLKYLGMKPFLLTHWPVHLKFFDMKVNDRDSRIVNSCDLILPFSGEAVGGSEREYTYERLRKKLEESQMLKLIKERGGRIEDFDWFLNFYKNNKANLHSGFGVGFNRVIQSMLKLPDIRMSTVFPLNKEMIY
ncbi:MAG: amino acid--tRNA ligase-related protein [Candidatus Aenigmatarchaeota archaeon]